MTNQPGFRALCAKFLEATDQLTGHGDSPANPGSRLILTVDIEALEELATEARAALSTPPLAPIPVSERLPELRQAFEQVLNDARCGPHLVGNIELADRLLDAVVHWAIPLPEES